MKIFKTLSTHKIINIIPYIKDYIKNNPETVLLIGCDSQNHKRDTMYAIVIGLYIPKKGAHVLYSRFSIQRERDNFIRLFKEVQYSIDIAEDIRNAIGVRAQYIDIDINNDIKYKSNNVLASAIGYVASYGYKFRYKNSNNTELPMITYCADQLVK